MWVKFAQNEFEKTPSTKSHESVSESVWSFAVKN